MILLTALIAFTIINHDGTIERYNQQYESHYDSDGHGGYRFRDNEGNRGHLRKNHFGGYTYRQQNHSGPIVIQPQKKDR